MNKIVWRQFFWTVPAVDFFYELLVLLDFFLGFDIFVFMNFTIPEKSEKIKKCVIDCLILLLLLFENGLN